MTKSTETAGEDDPIEIDVETGAATDPEIEAETEPNGSEADEGPRAVAFGTATEALATAFGIDGRAGETITDLETTETDEGRQLVATVERSRSTMLGHRLASAKRRGRRAGIRAVLLGALAAVAYAVFAGRRLRGESESDDEAVDELSVDDGSEE